jgi:hypothetical protein
MNRDEARDFSARLDGDARAFSAQLDRMLRDVEDRLDEVWRTATLTAAQAVVEGNAFGPGVPVDTGQLRASWRIGVGRPEDGPSAPIESDAVGDGPMMLAFLDLGVLKRATTDDVIWLTTMFPYAVHLEMGSGNRRTAEEQLKNRKGSLGPTVFLEPVVSRWEQIVFDALRRLPPSP